MTEGPAPDRRGARPCRRHVRDRGRAGRPPRALRRDAGASLVEALIVLALVGIAGALAIADTRAARQRAWIDAAARHLALAMRAARTDAVLQGRSMAVQFLDEGGGAYRLVADGNGNGVRRAEIETGVDPVAGVPRRQDEDFPGVRFGVGCDCPGIEGGDPPGAGTSGIVFGEAGLAVFSPRGTATSGTAYLADATGTTYAVRVLGATGRTRVLRFDPSRRAWVAP